MIRQVFSLCILSLLSCKSQSLYTVGVYAVRPTEMQDVHDIGFNLIHTYEYFGDGYNSTEYLRAAKHHDLAVLLPAEDAATAEAIAQSDLKSLIDMPEELRIWKEEEKDSLEARSALAQDVRSATARTYKYIPWAYSSSKAETFAYLHNAFGVSLYWEQFCENGQALRKRLEDYQNLVHRLDANGSSRVPLKKFGIVGAYANRPEQCRPTAQGAALAFWGAISFGYDGVFVFSYAYRHECPEAWNSVIQQLQKLRDIELLSSEPIISHELKIQFVSASRLKTRAEDQILLVNFSDADQDINLNSLTGNTSIARLVITLAPQTSIILPWL